MTNDPAHYDKYFVIGFNKTGTSTFHRLFEHNDLTSQHDGSTWEIDNFQCFSDNGNFRDWKALDESYPNSIFILNVRPLDAWIRSRAKHCYGPKLSWGYPPQQDLYKSWILERNVHHGALLHHFKSHPEKLIIVDISQQDWLPYVCDELDLKFYDLFVNKGSDTVPDSHILEVNTVMDATFESLGIPKPERGSKLIVPSLLPREESSKLDNLATRYRSNFLIQKVEKQRVPFWKKILPF